jgi:cyclophilin family peptidyl-prolyl cis-trans isomerase
VTDVTHRLQAFILALTTGVPAALPAIAVAQEAEDPTRQEQTDPPPDETAGTTGTATEPEQAADETPEEPAWSPPPPSETVIELQEQFARMHTSLRNNFGLRDADVPAVEAFRNRVARAMESAPDDPYLAAMDLQIAMWLKEDDAVDAGFERLIEITGQAGRYGQSWLAYFRNQNDLERLDEIYASLLTRDPDNDEILLERAGHLVQTGEFARAIETMENVEWDPALRQDTVVALTAALMAEHRFDEAQETLDLLPEGSTGAKASVQARLDILRRQVPDYIDRWAVELELRSSEESADDLPRVELVTGRGRIVLELFESQAPNTVANFIKLVDEGYYAGTVFYRHVPGSLIEGGDTLSDDETVQPGSSDPGYRIPDEHEREDARSHFSGSVAMARSGGADSGGSRFYLCGKPMPDRNGRYTVFGRIIEGLDVARQLRKDDVLDSARVLRKRDHEYDVQTLPLAGG